MGGMETGKQGRRGRQICLIFLSGGGNEAFFVEETMNIPPRIVDNFFSVFLERMQFRLYKCTTKHEMKDHNPPQKPLKTPFHPTS